MSFFISSAFAADAPVAAQPNTTMLIVSIVAFVLIFYFIILRPQQKRAKVQKTLMESITKGAEVITTGGLVGKVAKLSDSGYITLALNSSTEVVIKRNFIAAVLPKGTMKTL